MRVRAFTSAPLSRNSFTREDGWPAPPPSTPSAETSRSLASTTAPASISACTASMLPRPVAVTSGDLSRRVGGVGVGAAFGEQPDHGGVGILRCDRQRQQAVSVRPSASAPARMSARGRFDIVDSYHPVQGGRSVLPGAFTSIPGCWSSRALGPCRAPGRRRPGGYPGQPPAPATGRTGRPGGPRQASSGRCVAASVHTDYRPSTGVLASQTAVKS